ncbi:cytochrome P450 4C1-like isoform X2 [Camponotus floridanus]|uniref:cytochrome P450 4C1-like isoform X2 n=1 Tax=Camponotus floridanus TaxID=104421 RepID=UPI000DC6A825|nr:cytochrome P450 4C1-like isoform X2 [Camponotus floridanus]
MSLLLVIIFAIVVIIFYKITWIMYVYYTMRIKLSHIPGTNRSLYQLLRKIRPEAHKKLLQNKNKSGLYTVWIGLHPIVCAITPECIKSILQSKTHVEKGEQYSFLKPWLGNGLITAPVEQWYGYRKIVWPTFYFNILEQFIVIMSEKTETAIKCIEKEIEENSTKIIDIFPFIQQITFNIICETIMGINLDDEEVTSYRLASNRFFELLSLRISQSWLWLNWIYDLLPQGKEFKTIIRQKKIARMQNIKIQNQQDDFHIRDKPESKTLLDRFLDINEKDNVSFPDEDLRAHVTSLLFAGHDTTAISIYWTLFCIGNDLKCQEKIREELKEVFKDSQRPPSVKELSQLKYLERVIKESRRLYPSIPIILRKISEDIKMDNYIVPKGTSVAVRILLVHRNPEIWSNPLKFDPDRFLPENLEQVHPYAYIPFSAGPRNCIGQKFAILEEKIILVAILRKWRVKSIKTHEEMTVDMSVVLKPKQGLMYLHSLPQK